MNQMMIGKELEKKMEKRRLLFTKRSPSCAFQRSTRKMKRRAKKLKASVISDPPNTRRIIQYSYGNAMAILLLQKWTFLDISVESVRSGPTLRILRMLIEKDRRSYMKEALGLYQYINTCVPDTLLISFHILSIKFLHIQSFLMSDHFFRELINTLNEEKYNYARALWIKQLPDFHKLDRFSKIKDHFSIVHKLVCAKVDYHQETPKNHPIYRTTLSKFRPFGDLRALGDIADPSLILVHRDVFNPRYNLCAPRIPPLAVTDDIKRKFELEVLLLGDKRRQHMHILFRLSENIWILYDNTWGSPFQRYDFRNLYSNEDFHICLAIYVNTTQAEDYMDGVSETEEIAGYLSNVYTGPFQQLYPQQSSPDVEMEDLSCSSSVPIPEIGKGVGTRPFNQNQQVWLPKTQEKPVEDVDMPSCSSDSDSD